MLTIKKLKNGLQSFLPASWWGETWREGYFSGNGHVGINVFGGALNEKILINSAELKWQGKISVMPDVGSKIKEIRKLVEEGNLQEAQNFLPRVFSQKNFHPQTFYPLPLAQLNIRANTDKSPKEYTRVLNTSNGEISVSYLDGNTKMMRNAFVSRADGFVVCELKKTGQRLINADLFFSLPDKINARTPVGVSMLPDGVQTKAEGNFLYFSARSDDGTEFGVVAKVTYYGGTMVAIEDRLKISGANSVLLILRPFANSFKEKEFSTIKASLSANKSTYDKLLKAHQCIHQKEMEGVSIEIEPSQPNDTVENLLLDAKIKGTFSPLLAKKMWNYGRYLLYSGTSSEGKIFLPAGLFNGNYKSLHNTADFSGKTESCYHSVFVGGMEKLLEPLFVFAEQNVGDMRDNALRLFGARGIFLPSLTAGSTGRVGSVDPSVLYFTGCAGYLAGLFFDYYLFTSDVKFLKNRALPFMREVALFYEDFFKLNQDGFYDSNPSCSPLSANVGDLQRCCIGKNSAVDYSVATQLLRNLIRGAEICGAYKNEISKWQDMLAKIPDLTTDSEGALQDYANRDSNFTTAGANTLYSAFASREVNFLSDEEIQKKYLTTARTKHSASGNNQTSMTLIDLARVFIRLGQKQYAMDCLANVVNNCSYSNLSLSYADWRGNGIAGEDTWSPMQLSSNVAFTTAIQEMLLYSGEGVLYPLPCLPNEWRNLSVENMQAVGNLSVSFDLSSKGVFNLSIKAKKGATFDLYLPNNVKKLKKSNFPYILQTEDKTYIKGVTLSAGKSANFTFTYIF